VRTVCGVRREYSPPAVLRTRKSPDGNGGPWSVRSWGRTSLDLLARIPARRPTQLSGPRPATLRASVGSTEASASLLARMGVVGPKHSGSVFAARCSLYACQPRLVNGCLTQMAPGDTTVGTTPRSNMSQERAASTMATIPTFIASGSSGHATTTAARSESGTTQYVGAVWVAVGDRIGSSSVAT
jgi:hypothetical protein